MTEASETKKGWLESIAGQVTVVGGIFATIFAIGTGFNTCASERAAKVAAFRQAVASEESYWKSLYDDYFSTFQRDFDERGDMRNAKRFAIAQLASHGVPDFEEFDVSGASKRAASEQLTSIKNNLLTALRTPLASGAEVSITLASQDEAVIAQADARRAESSAAGDPAPAVGVPAESDKVVALQALAVQSLSTVTLSTGRPNGWDVDVFWCQGPGESATYLTANAVAGALAEKSKLGAPIAEGVTLGRVRLRPLLEATNEKPSYGIKGNVVRSDAQEDTAAEALVTAINAAQPVPFTRSSSSQVTRWYLSVFACGG